MSGEKGILGRIKFYEARKINHDKNIETLRERIAREEEKKNQLDQKIEYLKTQLKNK